VCNWEGNEDTLRMYIGYEHAVFERHLQNSLCQFSITLTGVTTSAVLGAVNGEMKVCVKNVTGEVLDEDSEKVHSSPKTKCCPW